MDYYKITLYELYQILLCFSFERFHSKNYSFSCFLSRLLVVVVVVYISSTVVVVVVVVCIRCSIVVPRTYF